MVLYKITPLPLTYLTGLCYKVNIRFHSFAKIWIHKWREERGLPTNPNSYGPLTDKPDYSFLDGRPTPYGTHQRERKVKQKVLAQQIINLTKEVDFAVDWHAKIKREEEENKRSIINNKLKPKGTLLLKEK